MRKIKKTKLVLKITAVAAFLIMIVAIPLANAGVPKKMQDLDPYDNLAVPAFIPEYYEYDSSSNIYFRWGYGITVEEAETNTFPAPPYNTKWFIDGEEIKLKRYAVHRDDLNLVIPVLWMWYKIFGPEYFTAGESYEIRLESWALMPFEGNDAFGWRVIDVFEYSIYFY